MIYSKVEHFSHSYWLFTLLLLMVHKLHIFSTEVLFFLLICKKMFNLTEIELILLYYMRYKFTSVFFQKLTNCADSNGWVINFPQGSEILSISYHEFMCILGRFYTFLLVVFISSSIFNTSFSSWKASLRIFQLCTFS